MQKSDRHRPPANAGNTVAMHLSDVLEAMLSAEREDWEGLEKFHVQQFIMRLQADLQANKPPLAELEFGFLPARRSERFKGKRNPLKSGFVVAPILRLPRIRSGFDGSSWILQLKPALGLPWREKCGLTEVTFAFQIILRISS